MTEKDFFRVPCEFQLRFRKLTPEELKLFQSNPMRPSPYSVLRSELNSLMESMRFPDANRGLIEKAFQILINIDQRLERLEEDIQSSMSGQKEDIQKYSWFHGELGAGGLSIANMDWSSTEGDGVYLLDLLLPSLPEQRIVATSNLERTTDEKILFRFESIHDDDREFLHHFVASRERELLRSRASKKKGESD